MTKEVFMAFVLSQSKHLLEPGFRQGKRMAPRAVFSRHPVSVKRERLLDWLDITLIGIVAAISMLSLIDVKLLLF
jgi:hypothetical protein